MEIDSLDEATTDDNDSSGPGIGAIVGSIAAAVVVIAALIAAFLFLHRRATGREQTSNWACQ
ncbi:MAG: hypothetical protein HC767_11260 [Akkermansiaceae bacterium]|nr:hypothetical protein [Akkermansiaceae bacterium]